MSRRKLDIYIAAGNLVDSLSRALGCFERYCDLGSILSEGDVQDLVTSIC